MIDNKKDLQTVIDEAMSDLELAELKMQLGEAWRIMNVLNQAMSDEGESYPDANRWLIENESFKPDWYKGENLCDG